MRINLYTIYKSKRDAYTPLLDAYQKLISKYATFNAYDLFSKTVEKAQKQGAKEARESYKTAFLPKLGKYNIVLDEQGESLDSQKFSQIFEDVYDGEINLFVGGSYGLDEDFKAQCQRRIALSKLTLPHRMAKLVLCEQIYRSYTIIHQHPYHK